MIRRIVTAVVLGVVLASTASAVGPVVVALSPTNSAVGVDLDVSLVATFDQAIVTNAGNVTITNLTQGTGTTMPIDDPQIAVAGMSLTVDPVTNLNMGDLYAVLIDPGAVADTNGVAFAGITTTTTWQFTASTDANWSLVAYWPMTNGPIGDIAKNTVIDDIIDHPEGDEVDAVVQNAGSSYVYDATRDRIVWLTVENNRAQAGRTQMNRNFTWSVWAKTVGGDGGPMMGTRSGDYTRFTPNALSGSYISFTYDNPHNDNTWHHFVFRRTGNLFEAFADGELVGSKTQVEGDNNMVLELGGSSRYKEDLNGYMSDAAIWKESLSETRIGLLAAGKPVIADITPPVITELAPTNGASGVGVGANLVIHFDDVIVTNAGSIVISNLTDSTGATITVPGTDPDGGVTVSGTMLTINPTVNLDPLNTYAILIDAGVIENEYGYAFAGIDDTDTWRFTTDGPDGIAPTLASVAPSNNATAVPVSSDLVATFSENVVLVNGGVVTITNVTDGSATNIAVPNAQLSVHNTTLTIDPTMDLEHGDVYAVQISGNAIEDTSGNAFAGISATTTWRFTTGTRPVVVTLDPSDDAMDADTGDNLRMTFDRDVFAIVGGVIRVKNLTEGFEEVIVLQDDRPTLPGVQDNRVPVSGPDVTINPISNLQPGDDYAIHVETNTIEDASGHGYVGMTNDTDWSFTTETDVNANLVAYWPLSDGTNGELVSATGGADDLIDDPTHSARDATVSGAGVQTWVHDPERGRIVLRTVPDGRLYAGNTQMGMDFTWSLWAKSVGGSPGVLMGTRDGSYSRLYLTQLNGPYIGFDFPDYNDDTWHHMALRRRGDLFTVYVDGTNQASKTQSAGLNNMKLELGGHSKHAVDFDGYMSDVAIWAEALTPERIQKLAAGGPVIVPPPGGSVFVVR